MLNDLHRASMKYWQKTLTATPPKRARNAPHNWMEQKEKREREGEKKRDREGEWTVTGIVLEQIT